MKIVFLGDICISGDHLEHLNKIGEIKFFRNVSKEPSDIISKIADAEILVSFLLPLTKEILEKATNLKMVCLATTGCDNIDLNFAKSKKIVVCYAPAYATEAVAEYTIGLMICAARKMFESSLALRHDGYDFCNLVGKQLYEKTLGVIGFGKIGRRVAEIAKSAFGMNIISYDVSSTKNDLEKLLSSSEFITMHLPLTESTINFIDESEFLMMKQGVVLVNTARGEIINETALIKNLESGKIFAAGLDVLSEDRFNQKNPLINMKNVVVTSHIAFNTEEALRERSKIIIENIENFIAGKPINLAC